MINKLNAVLLIIIMMFAVSTYEFTQEEENMETVFHHARANLAASNLSAPAAQRATVSSGYASAVCLPFKIEEGVLLKATAGSYYFFAINLYMAEVSNDSMIFYIYTASGNLSVLPYIYYDGTGSAGTPFNITVGEKYWIEFDIKYGTSPYTGFHMSWYTWDKSSILGSHSRTGFSMATTGGKLFVYNYASGGGADYHAMLKLSDAFYYQNIIYHNNSGITHPIAQDLSGREPVNITYERWPIRGWV